LNKNFDQNKELENLL